MINYKHLHYFVSVARSGGVTRAAERLHLTPQTLSGQISQFEERLGVALFQRVGRRLELTETGKLALSYAEEIFQTGAELEDLLKNGAEERFITFRICPWLGVFERRRPYREIAVEHQKRPEARPRVQVFGLGRCGEHLLGRLRQNGVAAMGVDFDPETVRRLRRVFRRRRRPCLSGDATASHRRMGGYHLAHPGGQPRPAARHQGVATGRSRCRCRAR